MHKRKWVRKPRFCTCSGWIWWRPKATRHQRWFIWLFVTTMTINDLTCKGITQIWRYLCCLSGPCLGWLGQIWKPGRPTTMPVPSSVIRLGPMCIDDACDACFLRVDRRLLCLFANATRLFICCFLYHLYPLAIFAPACELFELCDLGLIVALGSLNERQHWPFRGSVPIFWQCPVLVLHRDLLSAASRAVRNFYLYICQRDFQKDNEESPTHNQ